MAGRTTAPSRSSGTGNTTSHSFDTSDGRRTWGSSATPTRRLSSRGASTSGSAMRVLERHRDAVRPHPAAAIGPIGGLFVLMMLMSSYDKSGLALPIGGRDVSVTLYKLIFFFFAAWGGGELLLRPGFSRVKNDPGLPELLVPFLLLQT